MLNSPSHPCCCCCCCLVAAGQAGQEPQGSPHPGGGVDGALDRSHGEGIHRRAAGGGAPGGGQRIQLGLQAATAPAEAKAGADRDWLAAGHCSSAESSLSRLTFLLLPRPGHRPCCPCRGTPASGWCRLRIPAAPRGSPPPSASPPSTRSSPWTSACRCGPCPPSLPARPPALPARPASRVRR